MCLSYLFSISIKTSNTCQVSTHQKSTRYHYVDLIRFVSALIVCGGHLFFSANHSIERDSSFHLFSLFQTGAFSVNLFFCLSGAALHSQLVKVGFTRNWIIARLVRLLPLYWICLAVPLILGLILGTNFSYPQYAYVLDFFGLQSFSSSIAITPGNPPLWSLSVEIILSFSLLLVPLILKHRAILFVLTLVALILFASTSNPVLNAVPFFYVGFSISKLKSRIPSVRSHLTNLLLPVSVLVLPISLMEIRSFRLMMFLELALCAIIVFLSLGTDLILKTKIHNLTNRSYSLYCVHFPVVTFIDKAFFPNDQRISLIQIVLSVCCISFVTEVAYQFVDRKAMVISRNLLRLSNR